MPYKKFSLKGLTPDLIKKAEDELGETKEIKAQSLTELKKLIKGEDNFHPCADDYFLMKFLRAKKFKVAKAFNTLKNYYLFKSQYSGTLTDLKPSDIIKVFEQGYYSILEYRDQNDVAVGFVRIAEFNINKFSLKENVACILMSGEISGDMEATQVAGYSMIVDCANSTLNMARFYASPTMIYAILSAIQDCLPARAKGFHFINEPFYIEYIYRIVRRFLSKKLQKRVYFHGSNLNSLHEYITPDILPEELGGKQGPMSNTTKKFLDLVMQYEDYFIENKKYGYLSENKKQSTT